MQRGRRPHWPSSRRTPCSSAAPTSSPAVTSSGAQRAPAAGAAPIIIRVPLLTPSLSSYRVALVTPVDVGLVGPLVDDVREEMIVRDAPPPGIDDAPLGFDEALA